VIKRQRAFTLIELLVVIAIIALLMAILMPALQRVKKQAKTVICQAHLKEWATIFAMYTDSNNGYFPERRGGGSAYGRWMDSMREYYITTEDIRCCPTATKLANPTGEVGANIWGGPFTAWGKLYATSGRTPGYYGSYGINGYLYVPIGTVYGKPPERFWRTANVKGVGNIPLFLDCWAWCGWIDDTDTPPEYDGQIRTGDVDSINRFCLNRHEGFINGAFLDYSVSCSHSSGVVYIIQPTPGLQPAVSCRPTGKIMGPAGWQNLRTIERITAALKQAKKNCFAELIINTEL
jgi:prepilin-type N-terminal cleavage/methylation domain-containing protein